jgi:hypothetical protein
MSVKNLSTDDKRCVSFNGINHDLLRTDRPAEAAAAITTTWAIAAIIIVIKNQ